MGVVYEGEQPMIGKRVAIKVLRSEFAENPEVIQRLVSEARAVNAVGHRGIIDVFAYAQMPNGQHCIVMEFLDGEPLDEVIEAHHTSGQLLPIPDSLLLLQETLSALGSAHSAGVIHRDLKPSNIFLCRQRDGARFVKLLDFGIAKLGVISGNVDAARASMMVGTPTYMAPEQAAGGLVSPALDLYAVGIMAFELLTGQLPFADTSVMEVLLAHAQKAPPAPQSINQEIPDTLNALVLQLLAKKPEDRPQSAMAVAQELQKIRDRFIDTATVGPLANSRTTFSETLSEVVKARRNSKEVAAIVMPATLEPQALGRKDTIASNPNLKPVQSTINQRSISPTGLAQPSVPIESTTPSRSNRIFALAVMASLLAAAIGIVLVFKTKSENTVQPVNPVIAIQKPIEVVKPNIPPIVEPALVPVEPRPTEPVAEVKPAPTPNIVVDAGTATAIVAPSGKPVVKPVKPPATGLELRVVALQNRLKKAEAKGIEVSIYKTTIERIKAKLKLGVTNEERDRLEAAMKRLEESTDY
jgi:serine/threonine protein kinase